MAIYTLTFTQQLSCKKEELWDFISSPKNLQKITPDYMGFDIKSKVPNKMYAGLLIQYKVSPVLGIKMNWLTEITQVQELDFFIDEQRVGPYKIWHHQHHLEENEKGTLMTDIITYVPPFGFLGSIANSLFINRQLNDIFEYRKKVLDQMFNL